ncbi:MAG: dephospho-CoA kinase [Bacteroidota bacterium]
MGRRYLRVGITGGIGAGKSTACRLFASRGRIVLSADLLARDLTERDPAVRSLIRKDFGGGVFAPDGSLLRRRLADIVFADADARKRLEGIVHQPVERAIEAELRRLPSARKHPYVLVEAALIFEAGMEESFDYVIAVTAGRAARVERVCRREGIPPSEVLSRMRAQMPQEEKGDRADFVLRNDGSERDLAAAVACVDRILTLLAQV